MSGVGAVLLLALLPGAGNFLGGMAAEIREPSPRFLNWALHAASGIVIAIVAVELMPSALGKLAGWWVALAFALGGMAYVALEAGVERLQGKRDGHGGGRSRMWTIYAAVAVDLTSDGLMIGTGADRAREGGRALEGRARRPRRRRGCVRPRWRARGGASPP
ncbi:MAG: hypothetical protein JW751_28270 [Polyangiaceae bacterium]|nr:hypothetical protein [Polyangiaceae bacterium]